MEYNVAGAGLKKQSNADLKCGVYKIKFLERNLIYYADQGCIYLSKIY